MSRRCNFDDIKFDNMHIYRQKFTNILLLTYKNRYFY